MANFNRATLAKVLEILESSHTGEALAAAKLASAMVREAGLTWDDVIAKDVQPRAAAPIPTQATGNGPFGTGSLTAVGPALPGALVSGRPEMIASLGFSGCES